MINSARDPGCGDPDKRGPAIVLGGRLGGEPEAGKAIDERQRGREHDRDGGK